MTYLLAVLAACAYATSSVLQRKAGRRVPQGQNLSLRLTRSLLHQPVWFGGILAVTVRERLLDSPARSAVGCENG
jgi:drug/metabolite transporter (DMT)-like permease